MRLNQHLQALGKIVSRLEDTSIDWAVTGSLGMALQGVPLDVHDIDIQTDEAGAYAMERRFAEHVVRPVRYLESDRMRSHYGSLEIDGIDVEIMGDLQKRLDDQTWEAPVDVTHHRRWIEVGDLRVPVLSLEYEYRAYLKMGRTDRAEKLRAWLQENRPR
jgi:hypothetical protein